MKTLPCHRLIRDDLVDINPKELLDNQLKVWGKMEENGGLSEKKWYLIEENEGFYHQTYGFN